jgi:hypothetical protein
MKFLKTPLLLLLPIISLSAAVVPLVNFRSQGINAARELVGWQRNINISNDEKRYGCVSITGEYTHSTDSDDLARFLFSDALYCTCKEATFYVEGSTVEKRHSTALMADQFYLPTDFESRCSISPRIINGIVDLNLYWGLDNLAEGLFWRIHMPIVHTRWNLQFGEEVINKGLQDYAPGYFDDTFVPDNYLDPDVHGLERSKMLHNFSDYIVEGKSITNVPDIVYNGLDAARIASHALTKNGVAELTAAFGWNFHCNSRHHAGIELRLAAPTGNAPKGRYLFEPIVGNGKHAELGGGLTFHRQLWQSEDEQRDLGIYIDANVTHLFRTHQVRTFDLVCSPLSRYMLAMRFTDEVENLTCPNGSDLYVMPQQQFAGEFMPVANITTLPVDSSVPVQVDMVIKLSYAGCHVEWDFGYNLWARSCEKLWRRTGWCCNSFSGNWALKGNAFVYGFASTAEPFSINNPGIALSATESDATIFGGTNSSASNPANDGIDCPAPAYNNEQPTPQPLWVHNAAGWVQVNTTFPNPELISEYDVDFEGACTKGISQKLFAHISYNWKENSRRPFIGIGGEREWGNSEGFCRNTCIPDCKCCSLSQWGIWIKGGFCF